MKDEDLGSRSTANGSPVTCHLSPRRGQIAVMFLVIAAVCVILAIFLINIGQVAINKTSTATAADAAALTAASSVGVVSRQLALALGDGKKYTDKKCQTDILTIVLLVIIIIVVIIVTIITLGAGSSLGAALIGALGNTIGLNGFTALIVAGIASSVNLGIKEGILEPQAARAFNRQFKKFANMKDPIRENAILTAFLRTVDDPTKVPDIHDINENGDTTEKVSAFSDWYDQRLKGLVAQSVAQKAGAQAEIDAFLVQLQALDSAMKALRAALDDPIIPVLAWIESQCPGGLPPDGQPACPTYDVSFWTPGDQTSSALEPTTCDPDPKIPCGPPLSALKDQVDWMKVQLDQFIGFADMVLAMPPDVLFISSFQIQEIVQGYWLDQLKTWNTMMGNWIPELNHFKSIIPWPPHFTITGANPLCASGCSVIWPPSPPTLVCGVDTNGNPITGCTFTSNPPKLPPASILAQLAPGEHPIDLVINALNQGRAAISAFHPAFSKFTPQPVSTDNPIYSWKDNRGWHHVQVAIGNFEIPRMKARSGFFESCVFVKHASQQIDVAVTRYDQDRALTSANYTLRYRTNAATAGFDDTGSDAEHDPNNAGNKITTKFLPMGIKSTSTAAHGYKPNTVGIVKAK